MKKLNIIFRENLLNDLLALFKKVGLRGATFYPVKGFGRQHGYKSLQKDDNYDIKLVKKMKVEILIHDKDIDKLIDEIQDVLQTGKMGDGKIWIEPIESIYRIRTGDSGERAI